ncbi:MAG: AmmeMemoRadiSam system radical SAM enzyme [Elusimicrobia bacterium]|nr:AmmeMemoRadiSam system radical SAM enzyme [Elusimicrobiota bacterium]
MRKILVFLISVFLFLNTSLSAKEAKYYNKLEGNQVQCLLCPRECVLQEGQTGTCLVKKNEKGTLVSLVYAKVCSTNIDPIEKKPLFHFLPGSSTFSIATAGCTLRCVFCQNWEISQMSPQDVRSQTLYPEQIVKLAKENNCNSISYTYSEPTAFYEYMYDTSIIAHKNGIKNVEVTSGYINPEPLKELCTVLDAASVDLKGFSDRVYRRVSAAKLSPVLETLKIMKQKGVWLEVGYLVIPTINDSSEELKDFAMWVSANLGKEVPVHFLRFFPMHKLTQLPPTPIETLERAYNIAKSAGLNYVYLGNVPGHRTENTYCPNCKKMLIERKGYFVGKINLNKGRCKFCNYKIAGVWD